MVKRKSETLRHYDGGASRMPVVETFIAGGASRPWFNLVPAAVLCTDHGWAALAWHEGRLAPLCCTTVEGEVTAMRAGVLSGGYSEDHTRAWKTKPRPR